MPRNYVIQHLTGVTELFQLMYATQLLGNIVSGDDLIGRRGNVIGSVSVTWPHG